MADMVEMMPPRGYLDSFLCLGQYCLREQLVALSYPCVCTDARRLPKLESTYGYSWKVNSPID